MKNTRGRTEDVGFCVVEMQIATKKETLRQELQRLRYIVNTPLLINCLTDAKDLLKFLYATDNLTYLTKYYKIEKQPFNFELFTDYAINRKITTAKTLTFEYSDIYKMFLELT